LDYRYFHTTRSATIRLIATCFNGSEITLRRKSKRVQTHPLHAFSEPSSSALDHRTKWQSTCSVAQRPASQEVVEERGAWQRASRGLRITGVQLGDLPLPRIRHGRHPPPGPCGSRRVGRGCRAFRVVKGALRMHRSMDLKEKGEAARSAYALPAQPSVRSRRRAHASLAYVRRVNPCRRDVMEISPASGETGPGGGFNMSCMVVFLLLVDFLGSGWGPGRAAQN
jgi:hypothetical protein